MPSCTPGSTTTQHYGFCKPADGETTWGTAYRTTMDAIDTAIFNTGIPRSYLAGLQTTPTVASTSISMAVGVAMGNDQATSISLSAALSKVLVNSWAVGNGNGGLYAATSIQGNQTYHMLAILRTDTGVVDAYFDTVATGVNIPSPYTIYRRVASFKTDSSKNIRNYIQDGDLFEWGSPTLETTSATPGTSAVTQTLDGVPSGLNVRVTMNVSNAGGTCTAYLSDLSTTDLAPSNSVAPLGQVGGSNGGLNVNMAQVRTSTQAQIRYRNTSNQQVLMSVTSWIDTRGRNA